PPQPESNARITWSPQLAGGPEASQKGLGQRMPAKLVVRSAIRMLQRRIGLRACPAREARLRRVDRPQAYPTNASGEAERVSHGEPLRSPEQRACLRRRRPLLRGPR